MNGEAAANEQSREGAEIENKPVEVKRRNEEIAEPERENIVSLVVVRYVKEYSYRVETVKV